MLDLSVYDIVKRLGDNQVLAGVSLTVKPGEVVALLGQSGSGKTTLLRAIAGLEVPEGGRITLGERTLFDSKTGIALAPEQRGLALVFQSYALWPHRSVFDNVAYGLRLRKVAAADIARRVGEVLARVGLERLGNRFPHQLSGGQQQRVALARALVYEPPILLMDEPLSNLDAKLREEARAWLRDLVKQLGIGAVYVTHDQVEAMAICDRIMLLRAGVVEQSGSPELLYNRPATAFVAEFMGVNNKISGGVTLGANGAATIAGRDWSLKGTAMANTPRGEAFVRVERTRVQAAPGPNRVAMRVTSALFLGERWEFHLARDGLTLRAWSRDKLPDHEHWVEIPPEDLWIF